MRRQSKRDTNEPDIVLALERIGAEVWRGHNWDLIVAFRGDWHMLEIKESERASRRKSRTAERQKEHRDRAEKTGNRIHVVWSIDMALRAIGAIK